MLLLFGGINFFSSAIFSGSAFFGKKQVEAVRHGTATTDYVLNAGSSANIDQTAARGLIAAIGSALNISNATQATKAGISLASSDIYVQFGGIQWLVTYLSRDTDGNPIATLWMSDYTTNLTSAWNEYDGGTSDTYPSNMYGTSKIRAVLNGTQYAKGASALSTAAAGATAQNTMFKNFTGNGTYNLTSYIVTPAKVSWQQTGEQRRSNDNWGEVAGWSSSYNYYGKTGNDYWKDDYLWLPSESETNSIWQLTNAQRSFGPSGSSDSQYNCWLRSGDYSYEFMSLISLYLTPSGGYPRADTVYSSFAVRPALHLNLNSIISAASAHCAAPIARPVASATTFVYNGTAKSITFSSIASGVGVYGNSATDKGVYAVTIYLKYPEFTVWSDTCSNESYTLLLTIKEAPPVLTLNDGTDAKIDQTAAQSLITALQGSYGSISAAAEASVAGTYSVSGLDSGAGVHIQFGGIEWLVTYLSKDTDGNPIATLWMSDYTTNPVSNWNDSIYNDATATYPSNMYGTSKIRAVLNGTQYATDASALSTAEAGATAQNTMFKNFTGNGDYNLTSYIVTPAKVSWQQTGQNLDGTYYSNDNWGEVAGWSSDYNYYGKTGNDYWKDDYLWLASVSEIGSSNTNNGIWQLTEEQRAYGHGDYEDNFWLRSGGLEQFFCACFMIDSGKYFDMYPLEMQFSVRPSLHLNLTEIINKPVPIPSFKTNQDTFTYNGQAKAITNNSTTFNNYSANYRLIGKTSATQAGEYTVFAELVSDEYEWSDGTTGLKSLNWTITPTYAIEIVGSYDSSCESDSVIFVDIREVDENGDPVTSDYVASWQFPAKSTITSQTKTKSLTNLPEGRYKISLSASINHVGLIGSMIYDTNSYCAKYEVKLIKDNYGAFYGNNAVASNAHANAVEFGTNEVAFIGGECSFSNLDTKNGNTITINDILPKDGTNNALIIAVASAVAVISTVAVLTISFKKRQKRLQAAKQKNYTIEKILKK